MFLHDQVGTQKGFLDSVLHHRDLYNGPVVVSGQIFRQHLVALDETIGLIIKKLIKKLEFVYLLLERLDFGSGGGNRRYQGIQDGLFLGSCHIIAMNGSGSNHIHHTNGIVFLRPNRAAQCP